MLIAASLIVTATISPLASADLSNASSSQDPCTKQGDKKVICHWDKPGSYTWSVPQGVTTMTFDALGAAGGSSDDYSGGWGGRMKVSDITKDAFPPGTTLQINVGGKGTTAKNGNRSGGLGGGGEGGSSARSIGGGGGATDIRIPSGDQLRLIVGGGGGGAGAQGAGGAGGGIAGRSGELDNASNSRAGGGATRNTPGLGGNYLGFCKGQAGDGFGKGGNASGCFAGAGGGGGGWAGGGGGVDGAGGGGGSGYAYPGLGVVTEFTGTEGGDGGVYITYTTQ